MNAHIGPDKPLDQNRLGAYLRDRRAKLDAVVLGFSASRRRTPGLRREEVAQRAHISATWYTWLEQGRGGAPSAAVLDRIARALMLTEAEREHLAGVDDEVGVAEGGGRGRSVDAAGEVVVVYVDLDAPRDALLGAGGKDAERLHARALHGPVLGGGGQRVAIVEALQS